MGVSTKGATKCSQQRDLTDEVARRWPMVRSLVRVEHEVTKPNAQPTKETRYYISSLDFNEASAINICTFVPIK